MPIRRLRGFRSRLFGLTEMPAPSSHPLGELLENNVKWAQRMKAADSKFFERLEHLQQPKYLWIGCSDSRVPANQVVDLPPGAVFVHRNIANVIAHSDFNCLSVMEYAVKILKVQHVIVCGHYGCGGVAAALEDRQLGLIDNWLRHVRDVHQKHFNSLNKIIFPLSEKQKMELLCELNVIESVKNACHTTIVQSAWQRQQPLSVHGWIYRLSDGIVRDLGVTISSMQDISEVYRTNDEDTTEGDISSDDVDLQPPVSPRDDLVATSPSLDAQPQLLPSDMSPASTGTVPPSDKQQHNGRKRTT